MLGKVVLQAWTKATHNTTTKHKQKANDTQNNKHKTLEAEHTHACTATHHLTGITHITSGHEEDKTMRVTYVHLQKST